MDLFIEIVQKAWHIFINTSFPVTFQGVTYNISLYAMFLFTSIISIVIVLLAKAFD